MSRPTTHADLTAYQREGHQVFSWNYRVAELPEVEQWLVKAKLAAKKLNLEVGQSEVRVPKSVAELDEALVDVQKRWDYGSEVYPDVLSGVSVFGDLSWDARNAAEYYAAREGLTAPRELVPAEVSA